MSSHKEVVPEDEDAKQLETSRKRKHGPFAGKNEELIKSPERKKPEINKIQPGKSKSSILLPSKSMIPDKKTKSNKSEKKASSDESSTTRVTRSKSQGIKNETPSSQNAAHKAADGTTQVFDVRRKLNTSNKAAKKLANKRIVTTKHRLKLTTEIKKQTMKLSRIAINAPSDVPHIAGTSGRGATNALNRSTGLVDEAVAASNDVSEDHMVCLKPITSKSGVSSGSPKENRNRNSPIPIETQSNEVGPEGSEAVPEGSEAVPEGPKAVPEGSEAVPEGSEAVPERPKAVPEGSEAVPEGSEAVPEGPEAVHEGPEAGPAAQPNVDRDLPEVDLTSSDFQHLSALNTFMDKTTAIEVIVRLKLSLATAPRRFGKSSLLSMVRYFFNLECVNGIPVSSFYNRDEKFPITDTKNYQFFMKRKFNITKNENVMRNYFGQLPSLVVNFDTGTITSVKDANSECKRILSELYNTHDYLLRSTYLSRQDKKTCRKWCLKSNLCTKTDIEQGLKKLSIFMRKHFGRKIMVIIDEYDSLCSRTMLNLKDATEIKDTISSYISMLKFVLKYNEENVDLAFLTGLSLICTTGLSDLSNVNRCPFLMNETFFPYYGFVESELDELLQRFNLKNSIEEIKENCNGYEFEGKKLFSFWSINSYLQEKKLGNFWSESGLFIGISGALRCTVMKNCVHHLLQDKTVQISPLSKLSTNDVIRLKKCIENPDLHRIDLDKVLWFYVEQGYLTIIRSTRQLVTVRIPNKEINEVFLEHLRIYYEDNWNVNIYTVKDCAAKFNNIFGNSVECLDSIRQDLEFIFGSLIIIDGHPVNEAAFHHVLYFILLNSKFKCCTEQYLDNRKRLDIGLVFRNSGIVIELKNEGDSTAALMQILNRNYVRIFEDEDYTSGEVITEYILIGLNVTKTGDDTANVHFSVLLNNTDIAREIKVPLL